MHLECTIRDNEQSSLKSKSQIFYLAILVSKSNAVPIFILATVLPPLSRVHIQTTCAKQGNPHSTAPTMLQAQHTCPYSIPLQDSSQIHITQIHWPQMNYLYWFRSLHLFPWVFHHLEFDSVQEFRQRGL